jgi:pimeloyl-ACP methyl ester carboxylesterase
VLLVGHSYGGAVISVAGASIPNAVGLVYVAAFALDEGESFADIFAKFGDTPLVKSVQPSSYPLPNGQTAVELTIRPELYRSAFAADLPSEETAILAVSQRPFAAIFDDRAQAAAWKKLPSWTIVATSGNWAPAAFLSGFVHAFHVPGIELLEQRTPGGSRQVDLGME